MNKSSYFNTVTVDDRDLNVKLGTYIMLYVNYSAWLSIC